MPVIGGLGIFMLGLEFMANGIQALSVNKMRDFLAKAAGTPVKGVLAGTLITGVIQSSTAMTVMVVGLVNAGVVALRPAISVIMGANIGTTLGNGLIALPLGPLGSDPRRCVLADLLLRKSEKVRNIALACMGFALIFYGLNLMTGGLRPLRNMPEVMDILSNADGRLLLQLDQMRFHRRARYGDDPLFLGDDRHRHGSWRCRDSRLDNCCGFLARRRSWHDDHLVDGVAEPVQERQACRLCAYLLQYHRRLHHGPALLRLDRGAEMGDAMVRRRSGHSGDRRRQRNFPAGACRGRPLSRPFSMSSTRCCCSLSSASSSESCRVWAEPMQRI